MRILSLHIDGYGRFLDRHFDLEAGTQLIAGPNEQGKSTLRAFMGDMLYGQDGSEEERVRERRRPWAAPDTYGGRLRCRTDEGRELEVVRSFAEPGQCLVLDASSGEDVSADYPVNGHGQPAFAERHLGVDRGVFLNVATITHASLETLAGTASLESIRERILALADSGEGARPARAALAWLEDRVARIGRRNEAGQKPLPLARSRAEARDREREAAREATARLCELHARRGELSTALAEANERRASLERQREALAYSELAQRCEDARRLSIRLDEAAQRCDELRELAGFPLDQTPDVRRQETVVSNAEAALKRSRREVEDLSAHIGQQQTNVGPSAGEEDEPGTDWDEALGDLTSRRARMEDRLEALADERRRAQERHDAGRAQLAELPDFATLSADPIHWVNGLSTSFRINQRSRDEEESKLRDLRSRMERARAEMRRSQAIFEEAGDLGAVVREYEVQSELHAERSKQLHAKLDQLMRASEARRGRSWQYTSLTVICAVLSIGLSLSANWLDRTGLYVPAGLAAFGALWFFLSLVLSHIAAARDEKAVKRADHELRELTESLRPIQERVEILMARAGVESVRELEALYEGYREARSRYEYYREAVEAQQARVREDSEQVAALLERLKTTFKQFGEEIAAEHDVQPAADRAIARYQDYRDAQRLVRESKDRLERRQSEAESISAELDAIEKEETETEEALRQRLRTLGFEEENDYGTALAALRAYRVRLARAGEERGGLAALVQRRNLLQESVEDEEEVLTAERTKLEELLRSGGCSSVEEWLERAEKAREYQSAQDERSRMEAELESLLGGRRLEEFLDELSATEPPHGEPPESGEAVREGLAAVEEEMERLQADMHAVEVRAAELRASARPLAAAEEDLAAARKAALDLEFELDAALHAAAAIEEVAHTKHARIAPLLAERAGRYLQSITAGAYEEVRIGPDLGIEVRIPGRDTFGDAKANQLSKGAIDQIYFALRLALVELLSEGGESLPMVLDDPFANYDDERLHASMRLLRDLAQWRQVLLFSCRQDVVTVARELELPVLEL